MMMNRITKAACGKNFRMSIIPALLFLYSGISWGQFEQKMVCTGANDGFGAYLTGEYRNLFLENGHTQQEIDAKVEKTFQQLFHGDTAQTIYFQAGENENGPLAYLCDVLHHDVRSEGMSYGMMTCVQLNKKQEFDALWNWAMTYMYMKSPEHPSEGYFSWSMKTDGTPLDEMSAPDGEEYMVMSLCFASARWGDGAGIYNYRAMADKILTTMRHHALKSGNTKSGPRTIGPMVNEDHKMICFIPGVEGNTFTDPSYHLPAFYELWSRWGPKSDSAFWAAAADTSRQYFHKAANTKTGLVTDYANWDGTPHPIQWNSNAGLFAYDSWRAVINWSVDYSWWGKDPGQQELSNRIQSFFASQGITKYGVGYTKDGNLVESHHSTGMISANAVGSLAANHPLAKDFVEEFWNAPIPLSFGERYYNGTLYMLNLLHCSGNFRIWKLM
jgi:oligosaccharide reducing-end xylanase